LGGTLLQKNPKAFNPRATRGAERRTPLDLATTYHGIERVGDVLSGLSNWMEEHEYVSVQRMQGSMSQKNVDEPAVFEGAYYVKIVHSRRPDPTGRLHF
jgi:dihydroorotate dehydrogenase (fumarate)